jgi:predicted DNA-binding protein
MPAMLSQAERDEIEAKIEALEQSRERCADSRIREVIEAWIKEQKDKLESGRHEN